MTRSDQGVVCTEGLQLTSNFTATVNAELKVGDLTEMLTVSGAFLRW